MIAGTTAWAADVSSVTAPSAGENFRYQLYGPESTEALPAILPLHGAGDHASDFIGAWKSFAKKQRIVLIAPELPRDPNFEAIAPKVFRCLVEDAKGRVSIDPQRVYVFGNSMGGYLAYDAAMFDSEYLAAVAVHAMSIDEEYVGIVKQAKRKTPIAIYIGDQDMLVPIVKVEAARELLERNGFTVHYKELKAHDHNFYAVRDRVSADA